MRISNITVNGLFGRFNHEIKFNPDERLVIIHGPNGFGKTMTLRIVDAIFNLRLWGLARLPFGSVGVKFDDASSLRMVRTPTVSESNDRDKQYSVQVEFVQNGKEVKEFLTGDTIRAEDLPFSSRIIEDLVPGLDQIGPNEWLYRRSGAVLDLNGVLSDFGHYLPDTAQVAGVPDWLEEIREAIPVRLIGTERLTEVPSNHDWSPRSRRRSRRTPVERTIRSYSERLSDMVRNTIERYATESQNLDRTFPVRVVEEPFAAEVSISDLEGQLADVETKRSSIVAAGFMDKELEGLSVPVINQVETAMRGVLSVYAQDAQKKLSVFDHLYTRVNTLKRIANDRLLYKEVSVGPGGLTVTATDDRTTIDLEMLSSGEQHELVLLCDLLFETAENSLILIDEPELSLHVAWQERVLEDLQAMADLADFRVLLATHSPEIIGDRWDLTVELKGPGQP